MVMKIVAITQARLGSTRLPGKILKKINGKTLLDIHLERINHSKLIHKIILATTSNDEDKQLQDFAEKNNISFFAGSENDVLDRFYQSAKSHKADIIIRLTSDCPLIDNDLIDKMISDFLSSKNLDYMSNTFNDSFPDGQDVEIFTFEALQKAWIKSTLISEREHVTPFIRKNSNYYQKTMFAVKSIDNKKNYADVRMTVDEDVDFEVIKILIEKLGLSEKWENYAKLYRDNIDISRLNYHIKRNEGYYKSIAKDKK